MAVLRATERSTKSSYNIVKDYHNTHRNIILNKTETWWLTLREERRLRVLENRLLRRISGPKRDEVTGEWR
jgi:hypothetical protein